MKIINKIINYAKEGKRRITNAYRTQAYKGKNVVCLICNWKGKRFFEHGRCPKCGALPRTRLLAYSLTYFKLELSNSRLLHVAPNKNEYFFIAKNHILKRYDRLNLIKNKEFINLIADLTNLPIQGSSYDYFIAWHVFEHIKEDKKAISEVFRVLRPGGMAIVSVPIYPDGNPVTFEDDSISYDQFLEYHGHPDHCRSCGYDYFLRFKEIGFEVKTLEVLHDVKLPEQMRFGLSKKHICWLFIKPTK